MNTNACNVEDINIHHITECLSLSFVALLRIDSASFAFDHSPCARMIWILTTFLILLRCKHSSYRFQQCEINRALAGDEQLRRDQQLLHVQLLEQNRELREAHEKSLNEMEEFKRFQGSTFDTIARFKLIEDRDTILELTGKIQELQNEINCKNDSRDFQDAESVRSGQSHVTSRPVFFPPHPDPGGMLSRSPGMPSRNNGPPSIWDTHGISGNVYVNPPASSSSPCPGGFNPWISNEPFWLKPFLAQSSPCSHGRRGQ